MPVRAGHRRVLALAALPPPGRRPALITLSAFSHTGQPVSECRPHPPRNSLPSCRQHALAAAVAASARPSSSSSASTALARARRRSPRPLEGRRGFHLPSAVAGCRHTPRRRAHERRRAATISAIVSEQTVTLAGPDPGDRLRHRDSRHHAAMNNSALRRGDRAPHGASVALPGAHRDPTRPPTTTLPRARRCAPHAGARLAVAGAGGADPASGPVLGAASVAVAHAGAEQSSSRWPISSASRWWCTSISRCWCGSSRSPV